MKKLTITAILLCELCASLLSQVITTDLGGSTHGGYYNTKPLKAFTAVLWNTRLDGWSQQNCIVRNNILYVSDNSFNPETKKLTTGHIYAINIINGAVIWKDSIYQNISSPVMKDSVLYYGSDDTNGKQYAFNARTGKMMWSFSTREASCYPPAILGNSNFFGSHGNKWYEIDNRTGKLLKEKDNNGGICCSSSIQDGIVYFVDWKGLLHAYNPKTATDNWTFNYGGKSFSSPAIVDGAAYLVSEEGKIFAINTKDGELIWTNKADDSMYRSPAVHNCIAVVITTNGHIYAFNTKDGTVLWDVTKKGINNWPAYTHPAIVGDVVYVGCSDGYMYAFELNSGRELWNFKTGLPIGTPVVDNGVVYFTSGPYAFAIH